jgi:hypothetical protein
MKKTYTPPEKWHIYYCQKYDNPWHHFDASRNENDQVGDQWTLIGLMDDKIEFWHFVAFINSFSTDKPSASFVLGKVGQFRALQEQLHRQRLQVVGA